MSLKAFHVVLMAASIALCLVFGAWSLQEFSDTDSFYFLGIAAASATAALGLVLYTGWFLRKTTKLTFFGLAALAFCTVPQPLQACAVCFGDPSSPMTKGAKAGILFLLVVISSLLVGFACLFLSWRKKDRELNGMAT